MLLDMKDDDGVLLSTYGYNSKFSLSDLKGKITNDHDPSYATSNINFSFTTFNSKPYIAVTIGDTGYMVKSSFRYTLTLQYKSTSRTLSITYPMTGNYDNQLVCIHKMSAAATKFKPVGSLTTGQTGVVNTDLALGTVSLATIDLNLYNYRIDSSRLSASYSPANNSTTVSLTPDASVEGNYNLRLKSTVAGTYLVNVTVDNITVVTNYRVVFFPSSNLAYINFTSNNKVKSTVSQSELWLTDFSNDDTPAMYFKASDEFNNSLSYSLDTSNSYLGAKVTMYLNDVLLKSTFDSSLVLTYSAADGSYVLKDNVKQLGKYSVVVTATQKGTLKFNYNKVPGAVSAPKSTVSIVNGPNLEVGDTFSVSASLSDQFGTNIASNSDILKVEASRVNVTAKNAQNQVVKFQLVPLDGSASVKFISETVLNSGTYTISATYSNSSFPCAGQCSFSVKFKDFNLTKSKMSIILNKKVEMSTVTTLQINNRVDNPLFNFFFFDSNGNQLSYVDPAVNITADIKGPDNLRDVFDKQWAGTNQILWALPAGKDMAGYVTGNYFLTVYYNSAQLTYPLYMIGSADDADAGNGVAVYNMTYIPTTKLSSVAGQTVTFPVEFRTKDNKRFNGQSSASLFSFRNSANLTAPDFVASAQAGTKPGQFIISVFSTKVLSSANIVTLLYNNNEISPKVELSVSPKDLNQTLIVNKLPTSTNTITDFVVVFKPVDQYGNLCLDVFNSTIFSLDRLQRLFSLKHSDNFQVSSSVSTFPQNSSFTLSVTVHNIGKVSLSSLFLNNTSSVDILPSPAAVQYSFGFIVNSNITAGDTVSFKIAPRDIYNNLINTSLLSQSDISKFAVKFSNTSLSVPTSTDSSDSTLVYQFLVTSSGSFVFTPSFGTQTISCTNCLLSVNPAPVVFKNSKLFLNTKQISSPLDLDQSNVPTFSLQLFDKFSNKYSVVPANFNVSANFSGNQAKVNFCTEIQNDVVNVFVCRDAANTKKWTYLVDNSTYQLTLANNQDTLSYALKIIGNSNDADASNGDMDITMTYFSTKSVSFTAGTLAQFLIEIRTSDAKRQKNWFDDPSQNISVTFTKPGPSLVRVVYAEKPGQYYITVSSNKTFSASDNNQVFVTVSNQLCKTSSVQLIVNPSAPVSGLFVDSNKTVLPSTLPAANADLVYSLNLVLLDKFGNLANAQVTDFNFVITPPSHKTTQISSSLVKNSDSSFTLSLNPIFAGNYSISSSFFSSPYSFLTVPGSPSKDTSIVSVPKSVVAGTTISLCVIPYDANNNYITPSNNIFKAYFKYKQDNNYVNYLSVPFSSVGNCSQLNLVGYLFNQTLTARFQNYFRVTNDKDTEIQCSNCVTDVTPAQYDFPSSLFLRYDSGSSNFVEIQNGVNEDNTKIDAIYRIFPRDKFKNILDSVTDPNKYSLTLVQPKGVNYYFNRSSTGSYIEFVNGDNNTDNTGLSYNTLTAGQYTAVFKLQDQSVNKTLVLTGRADDKNASNLPAYPDNTVINDQSLSFTAGSTGYLIIELRTVDNFRKNNWLTKVQVTPRNFQDASFNATVRPATQLGVYYVTVASSKSNTFPTAVKQVLNIIVNGTVVSTLSPVLEVSPSVMKSASIDNNYLSSNNSLKNGTADTLLVFKVKAYDTYNNLAPADNNIIKLTVTAPDKSYATITVGRDMDSGFTTYTVTNRLAGTYFISGNLLQPVSYFNKYGNISLSSVTGQLVDKQVTAGQSASISVVPKDQFGNIISSADATNRFSGFATSPSKATAPASISYSSDQSVLLSSLLTEAGTHAWTLKLDNNNVPCTACSTKVVPDIVSLPLCYLVNANQVKFSNGDTLTQPLNQPLVFYLYFSDKFKNTIEDISSNADVTVENPTLFGNYMTNITLETDTKSSSSFYKLSVPSSQLGVYNHLVSSNQYKLSFNLKSNKASSSSKFLYNVTVISGKNDTGYGNGPYIVSNTEIDKTQVNLYAGATASLNLKLKTAQNSYYNNDNVDPVSDFKCVTSPADSSFSYSVSKSHSEPGSYSLSFKTNTAVIDSKLNITISIKDPSGSFISLSPVYATVYPNIPPDSSKTLVVKQPGNFTKAGDNVTIELKLFDSYGNVYNRNKDIVTYNNLVVTEQNDTVLNPLVLLKPDGQTYLFSFVPTYPPRAKTINVMWKDPAQQKNLLTSPILLTVTSDPEFSNSIISGSNIVEIKAGAKLEMTLELKDKNYVCVDAVDPTLPKVTVTSSDSKLSYNYNFKITSSATCSVYSLDVPDDKTYNATGTYKISVFLGSKELKTYTQKLVAGDLDLTKLTSKFNMQGNFSPGKVPAGTELLYSIQGFDKFNNPVSSSIKNITVRLDAKDGSSVNATSYSSALYENSLGVLSGSLKITKAGTYILNYFYNGTKLNNLANSDKPYNLTVIPQSCSVDSPDLDFSLINSSLKNATTGDKTSFSIKCKDIYNNSITSGGEVFTAFMYVVTADTKTSADVAAKVTDNQNGSYTISFLPVLAGLYHVTVDLAGKQYVSDYKFSVVEKSCPADTPYSCPNSETCVSNLLDCIPDRNKSCPTATPLSCKVNGADACVASQTECDCQEGYEKCKRVKICVSQSQTNLCPYCLAIKCQTEYPKSPVFCSDGICRADIRDSPAQRVCPIGKVLCSDLSCRDKLSDCAAYSACPKNTYRCFRPVLCQKPERLSPWSISCPDPYKYVCPDGTCVTSDLFCKPLPKCFEPNNILCPGNTCASDIKNCPSSVSCGHGMALCDDMICRSTCQTRSPTTQ